LTLLRRAKEEIARLFSSIYLKMGWELPDCKWVTEPMAVCTMVRPDVVASDWFDRYAAGRHAGRIAPDGAEVPAFLIRRPAARDVEDAAGGEVVLFRRHPADHGCHLLDQHEALARDFGEHGVDVGLAHLLARANLRFALGHFSPMAETWPLWLCWRLPEEFVLNSLFALAVF